MPWGPVCSSQGHPRTTDSQGPAAAEGAAFSLGRRQHLCTWGAAVTPYTGTSREPRSWQGRARAKRGHQEDSPESRFTAWTWRPGQEGVRLSVGASHWSSCPALLLLFFASGRPLFWTDAERQSQTMPSTLWVRNAILEQNPAGGGQRQQQGPGPRPGRLPRERCRAGPLDCSSPGPGAAVATAQPQRGRTESRWEPGRQAAG